MTQKVLLATFRLEGNAELWYRAVQRNYQEMNQRRPPARRRSMRWADFLQVFHRQYVSEAQNDQKQVEFDQLE